MRLLSFIIAFLLVGDFLFAQGREDVDLKLTPLTRKDTRAQKDYGFILGLGQNDQGGKQYVLCPDCIFEGGAGFSFSLGMLYEQELFRNFRLGGQVIYNDFSFTSRFSVDEIHQDPESGTYIPIKFSHEARFTLNSLTAAPYIKFYPWNFMYFRLGMPIAYMFNNNVRHDKDLESNSVTIGGMEYKIEGNNSTVEDGPITNFNQLQLFLSPVIGFDFRLSRNMYLSPLFEYYIPLTELSQFGDASKVRNWKLVFELRVALKESSR